MTNTPGLGSMVMARKREMRKKIVKNDSIKFHRKKFVMKTTRRKIYRKQRINGEIVPAKSKKLFHFSKRHITSVNEREKYSFYLLLLHRTAHIVEMNKLCKRQRQDK